MIFLKKISEKLTYVHNFVALFLLTKRILISTGFSIIYINLYEGPGFADATIFFGNVNFNVSKSKTIANNDHVGHHPNYKPLQPIKTSDFDAGYVLISLSDR